MVTHAKLKNLLDKPQIAPDDRAALKRFHQQLKSTTTWLKRIGNMSAVHSTENLSKAVMRLPDAIRKKFFRNSKDYDDSDLNLLKLEIFLDWTLKEFYNPIADIIASKEGKSKRDKGRSGRDGQSNHLDSERDQKLSCWVCQKPHKIWQCEDFKRKSLTERRKIVNEKKCCYNCLSLKHSVRECKSRVSCRHCKRRHHSSLHDPNYNGSNETPEVESNYGTSNTHTYLQVIPTTVSNGERSIQVNALLDTGSDTTLIKSSLATQLNLSGKNQTMRISNVLSKKQTFNSTSVNFTISSSSKDKPSISIQDAWVVENLNVKMRPCNLSKIKGQFDHLKGVPLVQPLKGSVEVLIGADTPEALLHLEYVKGKSKNGPIAVKTVFGWTLFGGRSSEENSISTNFLSFEKLEASVERFWEQESYPTTSKLSNALLTKDEKRALSLLKSGTTLVEGRCQVGMLWKNDDVQLINNRALAEKRLQSTEKRLEKFSEIKDIYHSKINEYISLGHVKKLSDAEASTTSAFNVEISVSDFPNRFNSNHFCLTLIIHAYDLLILIHSEILSHLIMPVF